MRTFPRSILLLVTVVLFPPQTSPAATPSPRPNILFILADDLGSMDINAYATRVPPRQWCNVPVTYEDLFPTLLDLAGLKPEAHYARIDGCSLKPLFTDPGNTQHGYPRDTFYWHDPFNVGIFHPDDGLPPAPPSAIRQGDLKLIYDWSGRLYLHDLKADWREQHNLVKEMPDKARSLSAKLHRWLDEHVAAKYLPALNPAYDPAKEVRSYLFEDLRAKWLGDEHAIRSAAGDPRLRELTHPPRKQ